MVNPDDEEYYGISAVSKKTSMERIQGYMKLILTMTTLIALTLEAVIDEQFSQDLASCKQEKNNASN